MDATDRTCSKLRAFDATILHKWIRPSDEHRRLIEDNREPDALLLALRQRALWIECVRMLAYTLPEREAIWWSCMCVRHTAAEWEKAEQAAVEAAEGWVRRPEPALRREAALAASSCGCGAPGGFSAFGVVWSHRKTFSPNLCGGRGAVNAVLSAAKRGGGDDVELRLKRFILSGIDVGNGGAGRLLPEEHASWQ